MDQAQRRIYLIKALQEESGPFAEAPIPDDEDGQRKLLRSLMNVRPAGRPDFDVLSVQDDYLQERIAEMGITQLEDLEPVRPHQYLWQGDITTIATDAIVNAANADMTGCWAPCHLCIDNCIHTFSGMQLRDECANLIREQGAPEETGQAKMTDSYNLPCKKIIHTVGPIVHGELAARDRLMLASSYRSCYRCAIDEGLSSIAFCCISTGVFGFPNDEAARIAVETIDACQSESGRILDVVFNVFLDKDLEIYRELLA